jgi:hypothetical protein
LNAESSSVKCQVEVLLTVHADGSMTPTFGSAPSFSYSLTPHQPTDIPKPQDAPISPKTPDSTPTTKVPDPKVGSQQKPTGTSGTGSTAPLNRQRGNPLSTNLQITPAPTAGALGTTSLQATDLPLPGQIDQRANTCYLSCILRGLVETPRGKEHLRSIVRQENNGDYLVRLKTPQNQFKDVRISTGALTDYCNEVGRDYTTTNKPQLALECALLNLHQMEGSDPQYSYGRTSFASSVASYLNMPEDVAFTETLFDVMTTEGDNANKAASLGKAIREALDNGKVLAFHKLAGDHYVTITGIGDDNRVQIGDSLNPGGASSISLAELLTALQSSDRNTVTAFNLP